MQAERKLQAPQELVNQEGEADLSGTYPRQVEVVFVVPIMQVAPGEYCCTLFL